MSNGIETCENCRFFLPSSEKDGSKIGYCRANPPESVNYTDRSGNTKSDIARFPVVLGRMWCGIHEIAIYKTTNYDSTHLQNQNQMGKYGE